MIDETTIRERAYALWEKDGRPEGAANFYWHLAREQLEAGARRLHDQDSLDHVPSHSGSWEPEGMLRGVGRYDSVDSEPA
ncbi:DUF2934 domain-containing protein [Pseudomonas sp. PLMAX]|uniref:DUF2934 domain-containing protein n=1 Tax=Pseudomonas sp. PLMAX TaxID=2201998 RepID=UPI0038BB9B41